MDLVRVTIDDTIKYCWICLYNNDTNTKQTLFISSFKPAKSGYKELVLPIAYTDGNTTCKITAYEATKNQNQKLYFSNVGTVIFSIRLNTHNDVTPTRTKNIALVCLKPPKNKNGDYDTCVPWDRCNKTSTKSVTIVCLSLCCVFDDSPIYEELAKSIYKQTKHTERMFWNARVSRGPNNFTGFIRNAEFDFDMPFVMPGALGIRYMQDGVYSINMWVQMVYLACCLCGFNNASFESASIKEKNNVLCALSVVALGSTWASGYEYEIIDDTSSTWSSLGSTKDCEDFTITFVSIALQVMKRNGNFSLEKLDAFFDIENTVNNNFMFIKPIVKAVTVFIQTNFDNPCMLCGYIETIHPATIAHKMDAKYEGHAWGAIFYKPSKSYIFVECTCPVLPHSNDTLTISNATQSLYNCAITSPMSQLKLRGDTYGPASFQPSQRYVSVAVMYTKERGYAICPKGKDRVMGVQASNVLSGSFTLSPLATNETKHKMDEFQKIDLMPNFNDTDIQDSMTTVLKETGINTVDSSKHEIRDLCNGHNINFKPSVYIPSKSMNSSVIIEPVELHCSADTISLLPYASGAIFYVNQYKAISQAFNDKI